MTYKLPFGLKQKPLNHYFSHGVVKFSCREGVLWFEVKHITKKVNASIIKEEVPNKKILDQLLKLKSIDEFWNFTHDKQSLDRVI